MNREAAIKKSAPLFAALGDETRFRIVSQLGHDGPASIARLTAGSGSKRCGRESVWHLERRRLEDARRHLDAISRQWDSALERLRRFVEE